MTINEALEGIKHSIIYHGEVDDSSIYDILEALNDSAYDNGYEDAADWYEK